MLTQALRLAGGRERLLRLIPHDAANVAATVEDPKDLDDIASEMVKEDVSTDDGAPEPWGDLVTGSAHLWEVAECRAFLINRFRETFCGLGAFLFEIIQDHFQVRLSLRSAADGGHQPWSFRLRFARTLASVALASIG